LAQLFPPSVVILVQPFLKRLILAQPFSKRLFPKGCFLKGCVYIKDNNFMRLSLNDYVAILKFYKIDVSHMKQKAIKQKAEAILAEKLCRCIKKVDKSLRVERKKKSSKNTTESRAIAICKNSIFTKKNITPAKFKCKGTARLLPSKNKHNTLTKRPVLTL
jgi:hypothetical protein